MLKRITFLGLLLFIIFICQPTLAEQKFWSSYLMGTNYERTHRALTQYLDRMVVAYDSLPDDHEVEAVIAMGGVNKDNWRGVRYVDLPTLKLDSGDGIYGNLADEQYLYVDVNADMGESGTLRDFLSFADTRRHSDSKSMFTIFDHGASYMGNFAGIGPDDNTGHSLDLDKISSAISDSGTYFDLISFDACLMGSLEVAYTMKDHARYMLASEDVMQVEPTLMWDKVLSEYAAASDIADFAKTMVDWAVGKNQYPLGTHPTRSLIDLQKIGGLRYQLDRFGAALKGSMVDFISEDLPAYSLSQRFGRDSLEGRSVWLANDIYDFASIMLEIETDDDMRHQLRLLQDRLEDAVIYSGIDGSVPRAHGLCMAPLGMKIDNAAYHFKKGWIGHGWYSAIKEYASLASGGYDRPKLGSALSNAYVPLSGQNHRRQR
jgi:hypothetical protein